MLSNKIRRGTKLRHYKGGEYEVTGFAHHTETSEKIVLYRPLYSVLDLETEYPDGVVFARPANMFDDQVEINGCFEPRFAIIN